MTKPPTDKPEAADKLLVATAPDAPLAEPMQPVSIEALLGAALAEGRSAEEVRQIHALWRDVKSDRNLAAFNRAFIQFKKDCPPIPRNRRTGQYKRLTNDGRSVDGSYADLEGIEKVVGPVLLDCGLSYRWIDTKVTEGEMVVVCRLAHEDGHYEDSPSPAFPVGAVNRGQSGPQASASVSTFACRYSLKNALGLTTVDEDDDGLGANAEPVETITTQQFIELNNLLIEATQKDTPEASKQLYEEWKARLLGKFAVDALGGIPVDQFDDITKKLQDKIDADRSEGT